jgi:hypothetical protein
MTDSRTRAKEQFHEHLRQAFAPRLRALGFKGSGQNFLRVTGEVIHAITIQGNKYGGSCCVNLGIHTTFLPVNVAGAPPDLKRFREVDCEFRRRLAPANKIDHWWKYSGGWFGTPRKSADRLIALFEAEGEPWFQRFATVPALAQLFTPAAIAAERFLPGLPGMVPARGALAMAQLHLHLGDREQARALVTAGLATLGEGHPLRASLEALRERC